MADHLWCLLVPRALNRDGVERELSQLRAKLDRMATLEAVNQALESQFVDYESGMRQLTTTVDELSKSLDKEIRRLQHDKADQRTVAQWIQEKIDLHQWSESMAQLVSQSDLRRAVEQLYAEIRTQLRDREEWRVLDHLQSESRLWCTRQFVEEFVDRRIQGMPLYGVILAHCSRSDQFA